MSNILLWFFFFSFYNLNHLFWVFQFIFRNRAPTFFLTRNKYLKALFIQALLQQIKKHESLFWKIGFDAINISQHLFQRSVYIDIFQWKVVNCTWAQMNSLWNSLSLWIKSCETVQYEVMIFMNLKQTGDIHAILFLWKKF